VAVVGQIFDNSKPGATVGAICKWVTYPVWLMFEVVEALAANSNIRAYFGNPTGIVFACLYLEGFVAFGFVFLN